MKARSSRAVLLVTLPASLLLVLLASGCPEEDPCSLAPACDGNRTLNCEPACTVGPCSNGAKFNECGSGATCEIRPGTTGSTKFFRARAVCTLNNSDACDPTTAAAPTCDALGNITGCSQYKRYIVSPCSQAWMFFSDTRCCAAGFDGGVPDGGADGGSGGVDGGLTDGGTGGSDAGL